MSEFQFQLVCSCSNFLSTSPINTCTVAICQAQKGRQVAIEYLNPITRLVILTDIEPMRIERFMDMYGRETEIVDEAVVCVVGPCSEGNWYSIPLHEGTRTVIH